MICIACKSVFLSSQIKKIHESHESKKIEEAVHCSVSGFILYPFYKSGAINCL